MWNLIQRYITGRCTEEELRSIEEWMSRTPSNRRLVDELQQIWELAPEEDFEVNADIALERFKQKMNQKQKTDFEDNAVVATPLRVDKRRLDLAEKDLNRLEAEQSIWKNFFTRGCSHIDCRFDWMVCRYSFRREKGFGLTRGNCDAAGYNPEREKRGNKFFRWQQNHFEFCEHPAVSKRIHWS